MSMTIIISRMVRRTEIMTIVAILWIWLLLTTMTIIVPVRGQYIGLPEEVKADIHYQALKEEISKSFVAPSGNVPEETLKAMNEELRKTGLEVVSTPEYIESFKELYNKTNGFTESTEMIGSFYRMTIEEVANRIIETTSFPQLKEMSIEIKNKLKEVPYSEHYKAFRMITGLEPKTTYNYTEPQANSLEEQLKLTQKKLEEAGVYGVFGVPSEVPADSEINMEKVRGEIMLLKILLEHIESRLTSLEQELHLN